MTVNHDVTGSSPVGGAKKNSSTKWGCSFLFTQADSEAGAYSFREKTIRFTVEAVVGDVVTQKRLALGSSPVGGAKIKKSTFSRISKMPIFLF